MSSHNNTLIISENVDTIRDRKSQTLILFLVLMFTQSTWADDWLTYRGDAARSGYTSESLPDKLSLKWTYYPAHAPQPAWSRSQRMTFDRAYHSVISQGKLYFGSSVDCKVYALDAATGKPIWSFFTGGPIRFAPVVWKDRLFVVSDDGYLYALSTATGKLLWKRHGAPRNRMILGNRRMTSRWPARGGPVVVENILYFASGIWPTDGLYLHAIDVQTGDSIWVNDNSGALEMDQPHGGARAKSGVSAQGYLVASNNRLLVPTGRAVPAAFNRSNGKFEYFHLRKNSKKGGAFTISLKSMFYNSGTLFDLTTGMSKSHLEEGPVAVLSDGIIHATQQRLAAFRLVEKTTRDRRGKTIHVRVPQKIWSLDSVQNTASLIVANKEIICGGTNNVTIVDEEKRKVRWSTKVDGVVHALAVANGRLYVGTNRGTIYCFGRKTEQEPVVIKPLKEQSPYGKNADYAQAAKEIIQKTGITKGYCLDLGCGDGALAYEIAKRTQLQIYAVTDNPQDAKEARRKLDLAGLYGSRVTVHLAKLDKTNYPASFADLVISARSLTPNSKALPTQELIRLQHPFGGVACIGKLGNMQKSVRGDLPGAGSWTHQYANAANTCCSTDIRVKGPLEMLWFHDVNFEMPDRHTRAPAPLFHRGKLVVMGLNALRAVDAYNGRHLWEFPLKDILKPHNREEHNLGVSGTGGLFCLSDDSVYVRWGGRCLRIDLQSGKLIREFKVPNRPDGKPGRWGFLAYENGTLFGSVANEVHQVQNPRWQWVEGGGIKWSTESMRTESASLFALDVATGKQKWTYTAQHSIRHNAIAIGGGNLFLIDRPLAIMDKKERRRRGKPINPHPEGKLVALNTKNGKQLWKKTEKIFGTMLALSVKHNALLMSYQAATDSLPSEKGGRMAVFVASSGKRLWDKPANYITRPLINGKTIYAQGGKFGMRSFRNGKTGWEREPDKGGIWDLLNGKAESLNLGRSYGCGQIAGSRNLLVYRSATLGYFDLTKKNGTNNYGGLRLGCWINAIPAGGLVLVPDATSGCSCSYLNRTWFALQPKE